MIKLIFSLLSAGPLTAGVMGKTNLRCSDIIPEQVLEVLRVLLLSLRRKGGQRAQYPHI